MTSTPGHPFWVSAGEGLYDRPAAEDYDPALSVIPGGNVSGRWVLAQDMRQGDVVISHDQGELTIDAINRTPSRTSVYNFHVTGQQSYVVGCAGVWVHNNSSEPGCDVDALPGVPSRLLFGKDFPVGYHPKSTKQVFWRGSEKHRPTGIRARLTQEWIDANPGSTATIDPPGFRGGGGPDTPGHARGHLLANILGGPGDDPRNIVTIFQNRTNRRMLDIELRVRKAVAEGQVVDYRVTPIYGRSENSVIPTAIRIEAKGSGGLSIDTKVPNVRT